jgi:DNA-binding LytR/AlgR family response regulator
MNVLIIEDEGIAIRKLKKLLLEIDSRIHIVAELESVYDAKIWFQKHAVKELDLLFSDIQLSDGLCFEIFDNLDANIPIIFTTAYNEYALRAFKLNGVDYLLKPIQKEELTLALSKFERTKKFYSHSQIADIQMLIDSFKQVSLSSPSFISYQKDKLVPLHSEKIEYFYTKNQIVYAVVDKSQHVVEETMDTIENRLPAQLFFRANRQFIIQKKYVVSAENYFNNRLIVHLSVKTPEDILISREKATAFKNWLTGSI